MVRQGSTTCVMAGGQTRVLSKEATQVLASSRSDFHHMKETAVSNSTAPPSSGRRTGAVARTPQRRRRPAWLWLLLGLVALLVLGLVLYALLHHSGKKTAATAATSPSTATSAAPSAPSGSPSDSSTGTGSSAVSGGSSAAGVALVGGDGVAPRPATGVEAGGASGSAAATGAGGAGSAAGVGTAQGTVLFASDSEALDGDSRRVIAAAATRIRAAHPSKITVTGYTDVVGGQPTNSGLSQKRAAAVAAALSADLGPGGPPVTAMAKGQADPVASNSTATGRQQNRRASIVSN